MKFFIDTADVAEIREAQAMGVLDGVTTNPSLVAKAGRPFREVLEEICALVDGPISAEVIATDAAGMVREARRLTPIHPNICIKLPLTVEGIKACKTLTTEGVKTNVTLCFSANQALLAAKAGATFVSPFVGRLDDIGQDGMALIQDIVTIYRHYGFATQVLVAGIRHPEHVHTAALLGADVATIPFNVIQRLASHPLTDKGVAAFLRDWEKTGESI